MSETSHSNQGFIVVNPFDELLSERYLAYALSTITSRSLPDVRDGLKPVHRRILQAMSDLKIFPEGSHKKSARIVGDVMGRYHPHGDQAIYDALVRLSQDFSSRYPLIDGQGNFGNLDGDKAAAMRYTEAKMTPVARRLLDEITHDTVDFRPTYDNDGSEPVVLPANFPNLLANGSSGIAVGMATNIPPHNVAEICRGLRVLLNQPDAEIASLVQHITGPDFPTGGVVCEDQQAIINAYSTGRGSFRLRAHWEVESFKGGGYQIVITEIPYQVQKSKLIERLAEMIVNKKLPLIQDIRDESAEDVRVIIEPRNRNIDADVLMDNLFKVSDLEIKFSLNLNVLTDQGRIPRVLNLRQCLQAYLDHRLEILLRRTDYRLKQITNRLMLLEGYLICYLNLDEIIAIIRESDQPKPEMMTRFELNEYQAEAILNMRLRALRRLEEVEIKKEHKALTKEQGELNKLMKDPSSQRHHLELELLALEEDFSEQTALGKRRTQIKGAPAELDANIEEFIPRESITVICSLKGWIRTIKGNVESLDTLKFKDDDGFAFMVKMTTVDKLLVLMSNGRFYALAGDKLPGGRGRGEPLSILLDIEAGDYVVSMKKHEPDQQLLIASKLGRGFIVREKDCFAQTRLGKQILNLSDDDLAGHIVIVQGDHISAIGENRKMLVFPLAEMPEMSRGRGVKIINLAGGNLADIITFNLDEGLVCHTGDRMRTFSAEGLAFWQGKRAQKGKLPPQGFPRTGRFQKRPDQA